MISEYLGIDSDYIVIGLAALVLILIIVMIVNAAKMHSLKKAYNNFMTGKDAKNLEDTILKRLDQVEQLMDSNEKNEKNINRIFSQSVFVAKGSKKINPQEFAQSSRPSFKRHTALQFPTER